jgi:hypothetical protein
VFIDCHPAGGYLELVPDGDFVVLRCHWPFDVADDEWVNIQNRYLLTDYRQAVNSAMISGTGKAQGVDGGFLKISRLNDGFALEFSRPQTGWSASSLQRHVKRPVAELLPQAPETLSTVLRSQRVLAG